jgi:hypothetical protein
MSTPIEDIRDDAGRRGAGISEITIVGIEDTIAALRALEPDVLKRMNKVIRADLTKVKTVAQTSFGMAASSWSEPTPQGNYAVRMVSRGEKMGGSVRAVSKWAAIFEFAGTKGKSRSGGPITPQGRAMVRWLGSGFGRPGRFLWDSWDMQKTALDANIRKTIADAEQELQGSLNAAGEAW